MRTFLPFLRIPSVVLFSALALGTSVGCGAEDVAAPESLQTQAAAIGGDCSTDLGTCYQTCQGETPTPTEQCFTQCECKFYTCIQSPSPACGPGGVSQ